jgi:UDP-glucose 4-epimerase
MNILVTGGAGFIGSHIAERLLQEGHSVVVLDDMDPFYDLRIKERNLDLLRETGGDRFTFVEGSITDETVVRETMLDHDVEFIYHQAAIAGVRPSVEDPKRYEQTNVLGLLTVLEAAEEAGVERLVHASSGSVNGEVQYLPYDEEHPTNPKSPYSVTKLACEHHCRVWNDLRDVNTVSLRHFTVYGPRMRPNMAITNFTSRCLNGDPPIVYGDGEQTRDFTHVDDIVDANLALLSTDAADGEVLNVGSTGNITINDLAQHIVEQSSADVNIVYEDAKEADARHSQADVSKARDLLEYEPSIGIREGVADFLEWYRANREWYEPLVISS